jgi:hypothetical protein
MDCMTIHSQKFSERCKRIHMIFHKKNSHALRYRGTRVNGTSSVTNNLSQQPC